MKTCSNCHKQFEDNFLFCPHCKHSPSESNDLQSCSFEKRPQDLRDEQIVSSSVAQNKASSEKSKCSRFHGPKSYKSRRIRIARRIVLSCLCFVLVLTVSIGAFGYYYFNYMLGLIGRDENFNSLNSDDIGISSDTHTDDSIINIALFGTDSRQNNDNGRADAQLILTIDKKHNKIKLTSIARDTKVKVDGYGYQKITNAWRFGAMSKNKNVTASSLAVKTINQNFNVDIMDYVEVNFFQFADIIDYLGGVELDVDASEKKVMNNTYISYINDMGIKCKPITKTGLQLLSGGQALAYARNRYSGSGDIARGGRQREVLIAIYEKFKDTSITKYPSIISMVLPNCITSLTNDEILDLAVWAATNKPTIEQLSLPTDDLKAYGQTVNGAWHFVYDLDKASTILHNFIYEPENTDKTQEK